MSKNFDIERIVDQLLRLGQKEKWLFPTRFLNVEELGKETSRVIDLNASRPPEYLGSKVATLWFSQVGRFLRPEYRQKLVSRVASIVLNSLKEEKAPAPNKRQPSPKKVVAPIPSTPITKKASPRRSPSPKKVVAPIPSAPIKKKASPKQKTSPPPSPRKTVLPPAPAKQTTLPFVAKEKASPKRKASPSPRRSPSPRLKASPSLSSSSTDGSEESSE